MMGAALAAPLLCVSGFAALVYELVWIREFGFLLGNATATLSAVLAAYMAGLALGSRVAAAYAARIRRPLRAYGLLELAIGAAGYAVLHGLAALHDRLGPVGLADPEGAGAMIARFVIAAGVLLLPTALMGATLPLLCRWRETGPDRAATTVGRLYAANTLGAAAGALVTGFLLIRTLGVAGTNLLAVSLNAAVGIVALVADRLTSREADRVIPSEPVRPPASSPAPMLLLFFCFASGALALASELIHARLLGWLVGNRVFASSIMLGVYLLGIALGAAIAGRLADRWRSEEAVFSWAQVCAGVALLAGLLWFPEWLAIARVLEARVDPGAPWTLAALKALEAAVPLAVPALASGAAFPALVRWLRRTEPDLGRATGRAYAFNTLGCIAGSLAAGYWLIPALGAYRAAVAAGCAAILLGHRALAGRWSGAGPGRRALSVGASVALAAWLGTTALAGDRYPWPRAGLTLERATEEPAALVTVWRGRLGWYLYGDDTELSFPLGALTTAAAVQRRQAWLPLLLHPAPRRALVVGLGFGVTSGALARFGGCETVDTVELLRGVTAAATLFAAENLDPGTAPGSRVLTGDGRYVLRHATVPYDLIVSNVTGPDLPGSAACYTREYFALARARLAPGGLFLVHAYGPDTPVILRTLAAVFPHIAGFRAYRHTHFYIASDRPVVPGEAALAARLRALGRAQHALRRDGLASPADILALLTRRAVTPDTAQPVNSDRFPVLEYRLRAEGRSWFEARL